ncbi:diguanylate cyclase [Pararhizobium sp. O133]|uniref:diguanylate cyclase n=1 Tax=Pararhizobium sp. O133 TaxID=3449278 RepID=UPI003F6886FF
MKSLMEWMAKGKATGRRRPLGFLWAVVLFSILIGFTALFAALLIDQRQQAWKQAGIGARNLDASIRRDILQSFRNADQALLSVRQMLRHNPDFRFDQQARKALLGGSATQAALGEIYILDVRGNLVLSSETSPRTRTNFANESYFFTHERTTGDTLFTPKTVTISPLGEVVVTLSRRLTDRTNQFSGVAVFSLRLDGFEPLFRSLELGDKGAVSLYATDGTLLLRTPDIHSAVGRNYVTSPMFWQLASADEPFAAASPIDKVERLFSASHVDDLPLIVAVGQSVEEIYAGWNRLAVTTGIAFAVLAICVAGLSVMLGAELRQRRSNEQRYRTLAHVDGLTGLYNRRRFDNALETEFANALKADEPLSVIMIDVDRFKLFNDLYGHQAGDDCLKAIAQTIQLHLKRPTDMVARYGGEEIAIILPNTDANGVEAVAEDVRAAIEKLMISHARSHTGYVTASLGAATYVSQTGIPPETAAELVAAADQALYGAKRSGRNRVVTHAQVEHGIPAPIPKNEAIRVARVKAALTHMTQEVSVGLDRVSHMAAQSFGTSMAFVTLIETTHQSFVGRSGLASDGTTRDLSFCAHALADLDALVVLDATRDVRFAGNAVVKGNPHIRFYAGAPLIDAETGTTLGNLCIADQAPRAAFSDDQLELLRGFASLALEQIRAVLARSEMPADRQRASA